MATTDQIDLIGIEIPLLFKIGAAIEIPVAITNSSGSPIDITGRNYTAQIGSVGEIIASFTVSATDLPNGLFSFLLSNVVTAGLTKGRYYLEAWEDNNFLWGGPVEIEERKVSV